jgi:hypothetical protein
MWSHKEPSRRVGPDELILHHMDDDDLGKFRSMIATLFYAKRPTQAVGNNMLGDKN